MVFVIGEQDVKLGYKTMKVTHYGWKYKLLKPQQRAAYDS